MSDPELIEGILRRDRNAFQYLVDTYQKQVIKTANYFIGNMEDAEDLSQEIFMEIIDSLARFKQSSALSTWIYRITVNRSLNVVKKNRRNGIFTRIERLAGPKDENRSYPQGKLPVTEPVLEEGENRKLLYDAISRLSENQRVAFVLHKFDDLPYKEIALIMGVSLSSVESLIHRAKKNLQKRLIHHFSDYSKN